MDALKRQEDAIPGASPLLQKAAVAVVGAGGTGSAVVAQLAHVGIGTIHVIDYDGVEETNLNRLYGATMDDVKNSSSKVDVLARAFGHLPQTNIIPHRAKLGKDDLDEVLRSADVIVGCVDSHQGRHYLNEAAQDLQTLLIDVGCKVQLRTRGEIHQLCAEIRRVVPGQSCLYCFGAITPEGLEWEALSNEERSGRVADGYAERPGAESAIVMMTTYGAAIVATQVVAAIIGQETSWPTQVIVDAWGHQAFAPTVQPCALCRSREGA